MMTTEHSADTDRSEKSIGDAITARLLEIIPKGDVAEISRKADVPYPSMRQYLAGRQPRPAVLVKIAMATGVRLEWLMTGKAPMRPEYRDPLVDAGEAQGRDTYKDNRSGHRSNWLDLETLAWALGFVEGALQSSQNKEEMAKTRVRMALSAWAQMAEKTGHDLPPGWEQRFDVELLGSLLSTVETLQAKRGQQTRSALLRLKAALAAHDAIRYWEDQANEAPGDAAV